jgi:hypothetical protein
MSEGKTDFQKGIQLKKDTLQQEIIHTLQEFSKNNDNVDLSKIEQYKDIFSNGFKEGSVKFVANKNGTGSLFIDSVIDGEKQTVEQTIDNKAEASFFINMQTSLQPPKNK